MRSLAIVFLFLSGPGLASAAAVPRYGEPVRNAASPLVKRIETLRALIGKHTCVSDCARRATTMIIASTSNVAEWS